VADGGVEPAGLLVGRLQVLVHLVEVVGGFGAAGGRVVGVGVVAQDAPVRVVAGRRSALVADVGQGAGQLVQDGPTLWSARVMSMTWPGRTSPRLKKTPGPL